MDTIDEPTHLVAVHHVDHGGELAAVGAVVDQDHAADLHEAREQLYVYMRDKLGAVDVSIQGG